MAEHRFQVNLKGIITLLSDNLYSGPGVYVRELLQNSVDAIRARHLADAAFTGGQLNIEVNEGDVATVVFQDNGVGLSEEEVHRVLATIGASSKRDELGKAGAKGTIACAQKRVQQITSIVPIDNVRF
jgi:molecular chaperone HtpG